MFNVFDSAFIAAYFSVRGCMYSASWMPPATGMSFMQPLVVKYALHRKRQGNIFVCLYLYSWWPSRVRIKHCSQHAALILTQSGQGGLEECSTHIKCD